MKKFIILMVVLSAWGCHTQKQAPKHKALTVNAFLENPFGREESVESFQNESKINFQIQKEVKQNRHYPEKSDTIYTLRFRKSEIHFYKTHSGKEFLLGGEISNKQIIFQNGIRVGMNKKNFQNRFSSVLKFENSSVKMTEGGIEFTFIFKNEKLDKIKFTNYFD